MLTVDALKVLYVAMGGNLTDTYNDIAGGVAVSEYSLTADVILALAKQAIPAGLPTVSSEDAGKALMVGDDGTWGADWIPAELPAVTGVDNGKVLTASDGTWVAADVPKELPAVTATDNGDVLTVADGVWAAVTPTP